MKSSVIVISLSNLSDNVASGGIVRLVNIFSRLADQINLTIICTSLGEAAYRNSLPANYWLLKNVRQRQITSALSTVKLYLELSFFAYFRRFKILNQDSKVSLYAASTYLPDSITAVMMKRKIKNATYVQVVHHIVTNPLRRKGNLLSNILAYLDQQVSLILAKKYSDKIIVLNPDVWDYLQYHGFDTKRMHLNFNGVDLKEVNSIKCDEKKFDCVFVGRIDPNKGIKDLVEIMKIVKSKRGLTKFIIVGDGLSANVTWLHQQISLNGLSENVILTGRLDNHSDVLKILKESKVMIFPSMEEGFGIVIVEALACGCVPVVWNISVFTRLFNDAVCKISASDHDAFSAEVIKLCNEVEYREGMLKKAERFLELYNWDAVARKEYDIISECE